MPAPYNKKSYEQKFQPTFGTNEEVRYFCSELWLSGLEYDFMLYMSLVRTQKFAMLIYFPPRPLDLRTLPRDENAPACG